MITISIAQCASRIAAPKENLVTVQRIVAESEGQIVVFPELFDTGYDLNSVEKVHPAEILLYREALQKLSLKSGKTIVSGCIGRDINSEQLLNQSVVFRNGAEVAAYSKVHLCQTPPVDEKAIFAAGENLVCFEDSDWKFGLSICYDLRFPEIFSSYRQLGVDAHILISAWPLDRASHWLSLLKARAIETQTFMIACGLTGNVNGWPFCGRSVIFDPWGNILTEADAFSTCILEGKLQKSLLKKYRDFHPISQHKRFDLYSSWKIQ